MTTCKVNGQIICKDDGYLYACSNGILQQIMTCPKLNVYNGPLHNIEGRYESLLNKGTIAKNIIYEGKVTRLFGQNCDGDITFNVNPLNDFYKAMLAPANYSTSWINGNMHCEIEPNQIGNHVMPSIGDYVFIVGTYRLDVGHDTWAEIHPVKLLLKYDPRELIKQNYINTILPFAVVLGYGTYTKLSNLTIFGGGLVVSYILYDYLNKQLENKILNVNLPTIKLLVDRSKVSLGETITLIGKTLPNEKVNILIGDIPYDGGSYKAQRIFIEDIVTDVNGEFTRIIITPNVVPDTRSCTGGDSVLTVGDWRIVASLSKYGNISDWINININ